MLISTRGRYALRVMIDLAEHGRGGFIPLRDVAKRQEISQKYMENIMKVLSKNKLVDGLHGKGGGYRLNRPAEEYRVGDILRLTEESLAPVACLEDGAPLCSRAQDCRTLPMWTRLNEIINGYLDSVFLSDLMKKEGRS